MPILQERQPFVCTSFIPICARRLAAGMVDLYEKYKDHFMVSFDNHIYNNQQLNAYFNSFSGWIEGNEARKCGIIGEENGLLILLALVTDLISQHEKDWAM